MNLIPMPNVHRPVVAVHDSKHPASLTSNHQAFTRSRVVAPIEDYLRCVEVGHTKIASLEQHGRTPLSRWVHRVPILQKEIVHRAIEFLEIGWIARPNRRLERPNEVLRQAIRAGMPWCREDRVAPHLLQPRLQIRLSEVPTIVSDEHLRYALSREYLLQCLPGELRNSAVALVVMNASGNLL